MLGMQSLFRSGILANQYYFNITFNVCIFFLDLNQFLSLSVNNHVVG